MSIAYFNACSIMSEHFLGSSSLWLTTTHLHSTPAMTT